MSAEIFDRKNGPKCVIYKITNIITWKGYVGQTRNGLPARIASHKAEARSAQKSGRIILKAIRKYGLESFFFRILEVCDSAEQLNDRERFWIAACGTMTPRGYNLETGGGANKRMSDETRRKLSQSAKGRKWSSAQREKMAAKVRLPHTAETKAKIALAHLGKKLSANHVQAIKSTWYVSHKSMIGKPRDESFKRKLSKAMTGKKLKPHTEEWKSEMSKRNSGKNNPFYGRKHTPESIAKRLEGVKRWWGSLPLEQRKKIILNLHAAKKRKVENAISCAS